MDSPPDSASDFFDSASSNSASTGERRRSERVKREKPDYYDALEFETKQRKTAAAAAAAAATPTRFTTN